MFHTLLAFALFGGVLYWVRKDLDWAEGLISATLLALLIAARQIAAS